MIADNNWDAFEETAVSFYNDMSSNISSTAGVISTNRTTALLRSTHRVSLKPNRIFLALPETHVVIFSLKRVILFAEPFTN